MEMQCLYTLPVQPLLFFFYAPLSNNLIITHTTKKGNREHEQLRVRARYIAPNNLDIGSPRCLP